MRHAEQQELAFAWRNHVFSTYGWACDTTRAVQAGEAGGFLVRCAELNVPAYLKPTKVGFANQPRAANEKIVADIAYEIGVSVPPVLLYRREHCPPGEEQRTCVSLMAQDEYWPWGEVMSAKEKAQRVVLRSALAKFSGAVALDTWIANQDRNNSRNVVFGVDRDSPAEGSFIFLDHAFSLNHEARWSGDAWRIITPASIPDYMKESIDGAVVCQTLERIEMVPNAVIEEIVMRIPDDYMTPDHRQVVLSGLLNRKTQLRDALRAAYALGC